MKIPKKIKLLRTANHMTQEEFAKEIGISRVNLTNIELGKVKPTKLFVNCVSLKFNINKNWLLDDSNDDLTRLKKQDSSSFIKQNYDMLNDVYKKLIDSQIGELLEIQEKAKLKSKSSDVE